jgi:hypothetical protein
VRTYIYWQCLLISAAHENTKFKDAGEHVWIVARDCIEHDGAGSFFEVQDCVSSGFFDVKAKEMTEKEKIASAVFRSQVVNAMTTCLIKRGVSPLTIELWEFCTKNAL